jgi:hypothetical protein
VGAIASTGALIDSIVDAAFEVVVDRSSAQLMLHFIILFITYPIPANDLLLKKRGDFIGEKLQSFLGNFMVIG